MRDALYMGTLVASWFNPVIQAFYQCLLESGKPKKVALRTCLRKLLTIFYAILKHNTCWNPNMDLHIS